MKINEISNENSDLVNFFKQNIRNAWITYKAETATLSVYLRHGFHYIDGTMINTIDLANISLEDIEMDEQSMMAGTGAFRELEHNLCILCKKYGETCLFIESVINATLETVLVRYGYSVVNGSNPPSYVKHIK